MNSITSPLSSSFLGLQRYDDYHNHPGSAVNIFAKNYDYDDDDEEIYNRGYDNDPRQKRNMVIVYLSL